MSVLDQIVEQIEALSPDQRDVLLVRLGQRGQARPQGTPGISMLAVAGRLDSNSAREMIEAIEAECEQVDARQWSLSS